MDIDVHHGNGTQWMFYDDPAVLYVSTHQYPFYPGTGAADETGDGAGLGFTVNVPLDAGATDADYALVYREAVVPILDRFAPELLLVSAGFDAHERDPLAAMRVTTHGYRAIAGQLMEVAGRHGALALVTEGGYELTALAACLEATMSTVDGAAPATIAPPVPGGEPPAAVPGSSRGLRALQAVRDAHEPYWRGI